MIDLFDRHRSIISLLLLSLSFLAAPRLMAADQASPSPAAREYTFGIFPFLAPATNEAVFGPIAAEISAALHRPVRFQSTGTFEKFMENLANQQYDIAHIQPFDYVQIAVKAGYLPLARRAEMLNAIFVVKPESPLHGAQDLRGKIIGLPTKVAASSYLAEVALVQAGIDRDKDVTLKHFTTHQACLQAVLIGDIDTCAAGTPVTRVFEGQTQRKFRVILTSPEIPQTLFVVHQRVPPADREIIKKTLLATRLNGVEPTLRKLFLPSADENEGRYFIPVTDKDYDIVRHYLAMLGDK